MRIEISNRNSSDIQSNRDRFLRDLGLRLLTHWGLAEEMRMLAEAERARWARFLLSLYDLPGDEVEGVFFSAAGVDPERLVAARYIMPKARQVMVLVDEEDAVVEADLGTGPTAETVRLSGPFGENDGVVSAADAMIYKIDRAWLAETVLKTLGGALGTPTIRITSDNLTELGHVSLGKKSVPIYLARRLGEAEILAELTVEMMQRHAAGPGIVLAIGDCSARFLGPNVVVAIDRILSGADTGFSIDLEGLKEIFDAGRTLVSAAQIAQVIRHAPQSATLILPGSTPLPLEGNERIKVFERLVVAHNDGSGQLLTKVVMEGIRSDTPQQLFNKKQWAQIFGVYLSKGTSNRYWRLGSASE